MDENCDGTIIPAEGSASKWRMFQPQYGLKIEVSDSRGCTFNQNKDEQVTTNKIKWWMKVQLAGDVWLKVEPVSGWTLNQNNVERLTYNRTKVNTV